jgi:hypothetical protein
MKFMLTYILLSSLMVCFESSRKLEKTEYINDLLKFSGCIEEYPDYSQYNTFEHRLIHKFRQFLHGQHLIMIGDSLTRYLYVSLTYALKYNRFNIDTIRPNIVKEKEWPTWFSYYNGTTTILEPELCDCYRHDSGKIPGTVNVENRYYFDYQYNFNISFFQYWGESVQGHWQDHGDYDIYRQPFQNPVISFWKKDDISQFFSDVIPMLKIKPSIILFNAGLWIDESDTIYFQPNHINNIISSALKIVPRVIYKTTTYTKKLRNDYFRYLQDVSPNFIFPYKAREDSMCGIQGVQCFNVSWTRCVNDSSYIDDYHFKADIYNHMLVQFENILSTHGTK